MQGDTCYTVALVGWWFTQLAISHAADLGIVAYKDVGETASILAYMLINTPTTVHVYAFNRLWLSVADMPL